MVETGRQRRRQAVGGVRRGLILEAAQRVFTRDGLEGASLRAIAAEAGYTPAALYFHFDSKEAIYAALLAQSLAALKACVDEAVARAHDPVGRVRAAAWAFFGFYADNPADLDLGFYLFRGGVRPKGVGRLRDRELNARLAGALAPIGEAARALGVPDKEAGMVVADIFAHLVGVLLLAHTGRLRLFGASAAALVDTYLETKVAALPGIERAAGAGHD